MRIKRYKDFGKGAGVLCAGLCLWTTYTMILKSMTPTTFQLHYEGFLSEHVRALLVQELAKAVRSKLALRDIRKQLFACCPVLSASALRLIPGQGAFVSVRIARPLILINEQYVLTEQKRLVLSNFYHPHELDELPRVSCPSFDPHNQCQWLQDFYEFFAELPGSIYDSFALIAYDPTRIELHDKQDPSWWLISSAKGRLTEATLSHYAHIKKTSADNPGPSSVDMRFEGMLVLGKKQDTPLIR